MIPVNQYQNDGYNLVPFGYCYVGCIVPEALTLRVGDDKVLHIRHRKLVLDAFWREMTEDEGTDLGEYTLHTYTAMLSANVIDVAEPTWRAHWKKLFTEAAIRQNPNDKAFFAELHADETVEKLSHEVFMQRLFDEAAMRKG